MHWFQLIIWASFLDPAVVWSHRCSCVFCVVAEEEASRFLTFCTNMKRIKTIQESEQGSATYGVNKFADISGTNPHLPGVHHFPSFGISFHLMLKAFTGIWFEQVFSYWQSFKSLKVCRFAYESLQVCLWKSAGLLMCLVLHLSPLCPHLATLRMPALCRNCLIEVPYESLQVCWCVWYYLSLLLPCHSKNARLWGWGAGVGGGGGEDLGENVSHQLGILY